MVSVATEGNSDVVAKRELAAALGADFELLERLPARVPEHSDNRMRTEPAPPLWPHQRVAITWALSKLPDYRGGIIAGQMCMGKSDEMLGKVHRSMSSCAKNSSPTLLHVSAWIIRLSLFSRHLRMIWPSSIMMRSKIGRFFDWAYVRPERMDGLTDNEDLVPVLGGLLSLGRVTIFGERHYESVVAVPPMLDVRAVDLVDLVFILALGRFVLEVQGGLLEET